LMAPYLCGWKFISKKSSCCTAWSFVSFTSRLHITTSKYYARDSWMRKITSSLSCAGLRCSGCIGLGYSRLERDRFRELDCRAYLQSHKVYVCPAFHSFPEWLLTDDDQLDPRASIASSHPIITVFVQRSMTSNKEQSQALAQPPIVKRCCIWTYYEPSLNNPQGTMKRSWSMIRIERVLTR
jgi:hypothetical protein